jgi:hypothetical protein
VPIERLRRHRVAALPQVTSRRHPPKLLAERAELREQVVTRRETAWRKAREALTRVPAPEPLDDRLRMDARANVGGELAHGRRPPQPLGARPQFGEDVVVREAPPQARLELGHLGRIGGERGRDAVDSHSRHLRQG